jgi:H+/Cl- antiporter ClcA
MSNYWISIITGAVLLAAAIPYVIRIRHPRQKPLAAYLIFVSVFVATAAVFFSLLARLAQQLGLGAALEEPGPILLFLVLVLLPALVLATWLARKPPWQRGPPS